MRILNISAQKPDGTGSGTYLAETVAAELRLGHEAAVICGVAADDAIGCLPSGVDVYDVRFDTPELPFHVCGMSDEMPYAATRYRDLTPEMEARFERAFSAALERAMAEFSPELVICHHLYLLSAIVRERVSGVPVVAVCHATDLRQMSMHGLERERICAAMRRMDAICALHEGQVSQIVKTYGVDCTKIRIVGTGYSHLVFNELGGHEERVPGSICFVGKISFKKGAESLIAALDLIAPDDVGEAGLSATLVGGHDPAAEDYARIAARARACRWPVRLTGKIAREQVVRVYRQSELFVLPSFYEGLPLVGIEAMACGCKVLMSALPGVREGMGSLLPGNPMGWVEPPEMCAVDIPLPEALPAYERRLADAIVRELSVPRRPYDTTPASWDAVVARVLAPTDREAPR